MFRGFEVKSEVFEVDRADEFKQFDRKVKELSDGGWEPWSIETRFAGETKRWFCVRFKRQHSTTCGDE